MDFFTEYKLNVRRASMQPTYPWHNYYKGFTERVVACNRADVSIIAGAWYRIIETSNQVISPHAKVHIFFRRSFFSTTNDYLMIFHDDIGKNMFVRLDHEHGAIFVNEMTSSELVTAITPSDDAGYQYEVIINGCKFSSTSAAAVPFDFIFKKP